jgi:ATP synthase protein I
LIWDGGRVSGCLAIDPDAKKMVRIAGSTGAIGLEVVFSIGAGYLGGQWLDGKLGTGPWLKYIGLVAGVGAAIKALIRVTRAYQKSLKDDESKPPDQPS